MRRNLCLPLAALLTVVLMVPCAAQRANKKAPTTSGGKTRTYYIAADEVTWDYAPGGINHITGQPFSEAESFWVASGSHRIARVLGSGLTARDEGGRVRAPLRSGTRPRAPS